MPPNQNIHNIVVRRLALAWIILSIVLGGIVFYLETESTDDRILNLAVMETKSFTSENLYRLNQPDPDLSGLRQKTAEFLKSHFVIVELYNRDKKKILEETGGNISKTADRLGLSRVGLHKKLERYGIRVTKG